MTRSWNRLSPQILQKDLATWNVWWKNRLREPNTADKAQNKENVPFSDVFNLPPTPCQSQKHRNFKLRYYSVLTAGERLHDMNRKEEEKLRLQEERKKKAMLRQKDKEKREAEQKAKKEARFLKKNECDNVKKCCSRIKLL